MIKKILCLIFTIGTTSISLADNNVSNNNNPSGAPSPIAASAEVTIAPSTIQLNQIKQFFDHSDYQHLQNTVNQQKTLSIPTLVSSSP